MARTSAIAKEASKKKYKVRYHSRCKRCGRPRGFLRKFHLCRICFRQLSLAGEVPGVVKSSW
jgi:small subunit ribosomal protein S14